MENWIFKTLGIATLSASFLMGQTTTSTGTAPTPPTAAQIVANLVARLTTLLTLTTTEQAEATAIFTTEQTALAIIRTSMQTAQTALQTAITANDAMGITTAATQIGTPTVAALNALAPSWALPPQPRRLVLSLPSKWKRRRPRRRSFTSS